MPDIIRRARCAGMSPMPKTVRTKRPTGLGRFSTRGITASFSPSTDPEPPAQHFSFSDPGCPGVLWRNLGEKLGEDGYRSY